jgi:hypothetical protein
MILVNATYVLKKSSVSNEIAQYQSADVAKNISALRSRVMSEIEAAKRAWLILPLAAHKSDLGAAAGSALQSHCDDLKITIRPFIGDGQHYKTWFYRWLVAKSSFNVLAFVTAIVSATCGIEAAATPRNVTSVVKNIIILIHKVSSLTLSSVQHLEGFVERYITAIPPLLTYGVSLFLRNWHSIRSYIIINLVLGITLATASIGIKVLNQLQSAQAISACKAFRASDATTLNQGHSVSSEHLHNVILGLDEISLYVRNIIGAQKSGRATQEQIGHMLRAVSTLRNSLLFIVVAEIQLSSLGEGRQKCVVWILALLVVAFQAVASCKNGYQVGEAVWWGVFALFLLGEAAFDLLESLEKIVNIFCRLISGAFFTLFLISIPQLVEPRFFDASWTWITFTTLLCILNLMLAIHISTMLLKTYRFCVAVRKKLSVWFMSRPRFKMAPLNIFQQKQVYYSSNY